MAEQKIYHERQTRMLCAIHALNNIFQDSSTFSKADFDEICHNLSPDTYINPHKNPVGLGNYDVNVLMTAVSMKGYQTVWFDKRISLESLCLANIFGFIINKPSSMNVVGFKLPIKRPHWFAVRKIGAVYYNLDSKLSQPDIIGDESELLQFLGKTIEEDSKVEILLVVDESVSETKSWKINDKCS